MSLKEVVQQTMETIRDNPNWPMKMDPQSRKNAKELLCAVASQRHLQNTIRDMQSTGYSENSPAIRVFLNRLEEVENTLKRYEVAYGEVSKLPYLT